MNEIPKGKRYFINGREISYAEAVEQNERNKEYIKSIEEWEKIKFITVI